mgnify:CR=1 FL=1
MAKLIVLSGVPGSGKSYFSKAFRQHVKKHCYIVSSDAIRDMVCGTQKDMSEDKLVWKLFYGLAHTYAMDENAIVIMDSTNSICKYRVSIVTPFRKLFNEIDLVAFDIPEEVIREQNKMREYPVSDEVLDMLIEKYEGPNELDCRFFDSIKLVKDHNIEPIIEELSK